MFLMILFFKNYYRQMLQSIKDLENQGLDFVEETTGCFQVTEKYNRIVRATLKSNPFQNREDETHFYLRLKPFFKSEKVYYSLLYYAALFVSADNPDDARLFWTREAGRITRFINRNKAFYEKYKKTKALKSPSLYLRTYEMEELPEYSNLIANLIALEKYSDFVNRKL